MTFENSNPTVADVCACLWFAKVVARDLHTSAATDNGERKQKITAVVTTGVIWSQVHLAEIWLQSLQCCQRVFDYRRHRKPILSALIKYMDVGSCLKRILEWLIKKKKFNPESLIHFMVLASGQLVVQALINSPFHIFALVQSVCNISAVAKICTEFSFRVYLRVVY